MVKKGEFMMENYEFMEENGEFMMKNWRSYGYFTVEKMVWPRRILCQGDGLVWPFAFI